MRRPAALLALAVLLLLSALSPSIAAGDKASRYYEDALTRFEKNDISGAIVQLKNALQQDPQLLAAHTLLGRAYLNNSQPDAAQESFERALRLGVAPSEVAILLAQAYLNQGKARAALERFAPDSVAPSQRADLLLIRGQAYRQLGNLDAAAKSFVDARTANPRFIAGYVAHADLLSRQGKFADAMKLVDSALAIEPGSAAVWYSKGSIYHYSGDLRAALENYGKALSLDPSHTDARVARASLLITLGRDSEATADIEYFQRYNPKEPRANYLRSVYHSRRGDQAATREAIADIVEGVDPIPINVLKAQAPELLFIGGLAHHGLNQFEEARKYLEGALQVSPGHVAARKLLGSILLAQQDYSAAASVLELARQQAPNDPHVLALLANA
jgi:putative PEP-CTERM system TPR-repeat lipoprotein